METPQRIGVISDVFSSAITYFRRIQNPDGGFPYNDAGSPSGVWATAGVLWALVNIYDPVTDHFIADAVDYLLSRQAKDGSLPFTDIGDKPCIDATAQFLLALSEVNSRGTDPKLLRAIDDATSWLCGVTECGAWGTVPECKPLVSSTSMALIALKSIEDHLDSPTIGETISTGVSWLLNAKNQDGGWGLYDMNTSKSGTTAFAIMAINGCLADELDIKESVLESGQKFLLSSQLSDGSWPDVIERDAGITVIRLGTPYCLIALLSSGCTIKNIQFQKGLRFLLRSFKNGTLVYQDSDIVSWSTRDGLLALEYVQMSISETQLIELLDQNIHLEEEKTEINRKYSDLVNNFQQYKNNETQRITQRIEHILDKYRRGYNTFRIITSALLALLCASLVIALDVVMSYTTDQVLVIMGIAVAIWGSLSAIIAAVKIDEGEKWHGKE